MAQGKQVTIDIQEIKSPELDAQLVAENVALQIERTHCLSPCDKKAVQTRDGFWREGIGCVSSGRLMARRFHGRNGIEKVKFPSIRCGRQSTTGSPKPIRFTARLG